MSSNFFQSQCYETRNQPQEKKLQKPENPWRLNNMLLKKQRITEEIKEEIKKYLEKNDNENKTIQNL